MRILHIITGLGAGGAETQLAQIASGLQRSGLPQHVVSLGSGGEHGGRLKAEGVDVTGLRISSFLKLPGAARRLAGVCSDFQPDVVQGWMYHGNVAAALAHRAFARKSKLYWNIRASNMDMDRYSGVIGWNARLSGWADKVISNSEASIRYMKEAGFRTDRIEVIPNGIDTARFRPDAGDCRDVRRELGIPEDALVAIMSARVDPMKDHANFLAAIAGVPGVRGLLVGRGTESLDLPGNVTALGFRDNVERLLRCADILVSSSAFGEGFSNALAEGMSSGLVPVATDVGDTRKIVGETGKVVPPKDTQALSKALADVASKAPEQLERLGTAARKRIADNFMLSRAVEAYARLYASDV